MVPNGLRLAALSCWDGAVSVGAASKMVPYGRKDKVTQLLEKRRYGISEIEAIGGVVKQGS